MKRVFLTLALSGFVAIGFNAFGEHAGSQEASSHRFQADSSKFVLTAANLTGKTLTCYSDNDNDAKLEVKFTGKTRLHAKGSYTYKDKKTAFTCTATKRDDDSGKYDTAKSTKCPLMYIRTRESHDKLYVDLVHLDSADNYDYSGYEYEKFSCPLKK